MKEKFLIILICVFLFSACADSAEDEMENVKTEAVQDSIPTLHGEFMFLSNEAILKGEDFIYGVNIDSTSLDLAERVKPFKKENFDMVPVTVKGKINQNHGRAGWNEIITIREVLEIPAEKSVTEEKSLEE